jgi:hypothetical protein
LYCSAFTDAERLIEFDQSIKVYLLGHGIAQLRYQFLRLPQATAINFKNLVHPLSVIARRAFAEPAILLITFIRAGYQLGDIALSFMTRRVIASRASNSIYVELLSTDE